MHVMRATYLGVELELNDRAHRSVNLVGEVLQASVGICDRNDLNHELARWGQLAELRRLWGLEYILLGTMGQPATEEEQSGAGD